jgi:hypothetical protein
MEAATQARERLSAANAKAKERVAELQDFVRRFSANKSKAKQATSRMKLIEKIKPEDVILREESPFPSVKDGRITLPNLSGHIHLRSWQSGDIVKVDGEYYKVTGKPKMSPGAGLEITYALTPSTAEGGTAFTSTKPVKFFACCNCD